MVLDEWVYILCSKIKGEVVNREIIQLIKARLEIGKKEYNNENTKCQMKLCLENTLV